jgi:PAS domain S-box-containing protein
MGFKRIIAVSIVLALVLAVLTGGFVYTQLGAGARARYWLDHTHRVIEQNQALLTLFQRAENSQRGYLLTGDRQYLTPFESAQAQLPVAEAKLAALVGDNADEISRVRDLNQKIARRADLLGRSVAMARQGDFAAARESFTVAPGQNIKAGIREESDAISDAERGLLEGRIRQAERANTATLAMGLAVAVFALLGLIGSVFYLARSNRGLTKAMEEASRAHADREASDALTRAIFANSPDYLYVLDVVNGEKFLIAEINPTFARVLNVPADAVRGRDIADLLPAGTATRLVAQFQRVLASDRPVLAQDILNDVPGGPRTWESILAPVKNPDGAADRIIGSVRDITSRVRTEQRLREAQRMESIGQLTGGVAHDFNNLLQVIRGNLELLEPTVAGDEGAQRRLANALHGADRAAQLTRQLLAFARRQPLAPKPINLSRLVGDMSDLLRRTLGESIEVETVIGGGLWNTLADPAQVESALLNLALNARDAMPGGGRLTIELTNASLDEAYVQKAENIAAGQYVLIAVSDTGEGMTAEVREKVFDPFFTTKAEGKGSGLGLSMVYGFVRQSNGHIRIYSEPGQGTTLKIYLPRSKELVAAPPAKPSPLPPQIGGRTILVVEDEPNVRAAAVAMLETLGYRCVEAADASAALTILETPNPIDLVFTDVVMPGPLKTSAFAERVRALSPDLPILFTSGYTENSIIHHGRLDDGVNLLSKPYARDDLARRIAKLLAKAPALEPKGF